MMWGGLGQIFNLDNSVYRYDLDTPGVASTMSKIRFTP